jgi:hypothetical protein
MQGMYQITLGVQAWLNESDATEALSASGCTQSEGGEFRRNLAQPLLVDSDDHPSEGSDPLRMAASRQVEQVMWCPQDLFHVALMHGEVAVHRHQHACVPYR